MWQLVFGSIVLPQHFLVDSALVLRGQIFEHSSNYFIIWKTTKMLIYQLNLNRLVICKKKHLNASVIKHSPPF